MRRTVFSISAVLLFSGCGSAGFLGQSEAYQIGYNGNMGSVPAYFQDNPEGYCLGNSYLHPDFTPSETDDYVRGCLDVLRDEHPEYMN